MRDDFYQKIGIVERVLDKNLFEDLYNSEPFVCKLVLDQFKSILSDPNFDKLERQLILMKFLKNNYPLELSRDVVEYSEKSPFSKDYIRVIMEWNYQCSDFIKQYVLEQYDAVGLGIDSQTRALNEFKKQKINRELDIISEITNSLIMDKGADEND